MNPADATDSDPVTEIAAALDENRPPALWAAIAYERGDAWAACGDPVAMARVLAAAGETGPDGALTRALAAATTEGGRAAINAALPDERDRVVLPEMLAELRDALRDARAGRARAVRWLEAAVYTVAGSAGRVSLCRSLCAALRAECPQGPPLASLRAGG